VFRKIFAPRKDGVNGQIRGFHGAEDDDVVLPGFDAV
jgi:hypothetical protein